MFAMIYNSQRPSVYPRRDANLINGRWKVFPGCYGNSDDYGMWMVQSFEKNVFVSYIVYLFTNYLLLFVIVHY